MPTGFTEIIERKPDLSFRDFALRCARAFGALVMMRDDPLDTPIPEKFIPCDYHEKEITRAKTALSSLMASSDEQLAAEMEEKRREVRKKNDEYRANSLAKCALYDRMRAMVEAWTPPTSEHEGLKKFMLEQIDTSVRHEREPYQATEPPTNVAAYRAERMQRLTRDLEYHTKGWTEECRRTEDRNRWARELISSLEAK